ncbi:MAG: hypothetical protein J0I67_25100, partial [Bosea sp.]|nr:hypothetical protein [Bosea sp. (in: a-proteobacteria)]
MLGFALAVLGLDLGADGLVAIAGALGAPVTVATAAAVAAATLLALLLVVLLLALGALFLS